MTLHNASYRDTYATLLINQNVNIREVSKRLSHSNTSTTLNIYTHALQSADKVAAYKLNTIMFGNEDNTENDEAK